MLGVAAFRLCLHGHGVYGGYQRLEYDGCCQMAHLTGLIVLRLHICGGESSRFPVVLLPSNKSPSLWALVVRCLAVERRSGAPEVAVVLSISDSFVVRNIRDGEDVIEVEIGKRQRRQVLINLT